MSSGNSNYLICHCEGVASWRYGSFSTGCQDICNVMPVGGTCLHSIMWKFVYAQVYVPDIWNLSLVFTRSRNTFIWAGLSLFVECKDAFLVMQEQLEHDMLTNEAARLLLVDDDPMMLQAVSQMLALRLNEVQVDTADSAQVALQQLQQSSYDAVLSDIKMPGMNGLDLLETVQRLRLELPVVLMTGYNEHDLAIRALRAGAYDYLLKPVERDELVAALRRAIHTGQLRRQVQLQQRALVQYAQRLEQQVA